MAWVAIYPFDAGEVAWAVEHIDPQDDGLCEKAIFLGRNAPDQAKRFAAAEWPALSPEMLPELRTWKHQRA